MDIDANTSQVVLNNPQMITPTAAQNTGGNMPLSQATGKQMSFRDVMRNTQLENEAMSAEFEALNQEILEEEEQSNAISLEKINSKDLANNSTQDASEDNIGDSTAKLGDKAQNIPQSFNFQLGVKLQKNKNVNKFKKVNINGGQGNQKGTSQKISPLKPITNALEIDTPVQNQPQSIFPGKENHITSTKATKKPSEENAYSEDTTEDRVEEPVDISEDGTVFSGGGPAHAPDFRNGSLTQWTVRNIRVQQHKDMSPEFWPTYFAIVLWWIWRWRNAVVFNRSNDIPIDVRQFLLQRFEEVWRVLGDGITSSSQITAARREEYIKWIAPPMDWHALNSDGAAKGSEVLAVEYGLELAKKMGITKLQIQLDNQAVVQILTNSSEYSGECIHDVNHCKKLIARPEWNVEVKHVYREANQVADWLANQGVQQNNKFQLIQVSPLALGRILHNDVVGVALPRFVLP
uniref:RNase H type-1 domain-containing protein n=1 Tax=Chenopodium quinoa TaxID=63459 RepID=A0A803N5K6_CHEQI